MQQEIWTIKKILSWSTDYLKKSGSPTARLDAEILIGEVMKLSRVEVYTNFDRPLDDVEKTSLRKSLQRRAKGEPVAYITECKEFMGLKFLVNPNVLIPRPDTELLVEKIVEEHSSQENLSLLDIGTGSGCIAVSVKHQIPSWRVCAWDTSAEALQVARMNSENLSAPVELAQRDVLQLDAWQNLEASFDVVVSNPPYITEPEYEGLEPNVKGYEPKLALCSKEGTEFYEIYAAEARRLLKPNGKIYLEIGCTQGPKVKEIFSSASWHDVEVLKDYQGLDRIVIAKS